MSPVVKRTRRRKVADENREKRKPSAYNEFMKRTIAELKNEDPSLIHKEVFKRAASKVSHFSLSFFPR